MSEQGWTELALPQRGLCARCRRDSVAVVLRMFVQERAKGAQAGKTLAGRALRLCEPCGKAVFSYGLGKLEQAAAGLSLPEDEALNALRYVVAHVELDLAGKELEQGLDLDYLRAVADRGAVRRLSGERGVAC